jgi:hypothetical protein
VPGFGCGFGVIVGKAQVFLFVRSTHIDVGYIEYGIIWKILCMSFERRYHD